MLTGTTCAACFAGASRRWDSERRGGVRRAVIASLLSVITGAASAQAQPAWSAIGPPGGTVSALLTSPASASTLFAGTPENGVFVSADAGATWTVANAGLQSSKAIGRQNLYTVYALASDGKFVYAATAAGLYYTATGNTPSWSPLASTASSTPITLLTFDASTGHLFAAAGQPGASAAPGVYVASVSGSGAALSAWAFSPLPAPVGAPIGALALVPSQAGLAPAALMASVGTNLYTASVDPTSTTLNWVNGDPSASLVAGPAPALAYSPDFQQAYACAGSAGFHSGNPLDAQALWFPITVAMPGSATFNCNSIISVPTSAGGSPQLLLGTDQGAFVSQDGVNFLATGSLDNSAWANTFAIAKAPGSSMSTLFAGTGYGISKTDVASLAGNVLWSASNGPASVAAGGSNLRLNNGNMADLAVLGSTLYGAAVASQYVEVFSSHDGGASWSATHVGLALPAGEEVVSLLADAVHSTLFAATTRGLLVYSPTNARWVAVGAPAIGGRVGALALGSTMLFVGTETGLYALALSAAPESAVPVAAGLSGMSVRTLLVSGAVVYAGTIDPNANNDVYSDSESSAAAGTAVWGRFAAASAGTDRITSLLLVGDRLLAGTNGGLVLYASSGSAWASANTSPDPAQRIVDDFGRVNSLYSDGVSIYAATGSSGVFVSPAGGAFSWTPINGLGTTVLPSLEVHALRADGNTLYAATRGGIATFAGINGNGGATIPPSGTTSSGSGGGAVDPLFALLTLMAALGLRAARRP